MKRTNIMFTDDQHRVLKVLAKKEKRTLGELVREAVDITYKKRDAVEHRKSIAIEAYQEGLISLGKLAEAIGMDIVSARFYLKEHGISLKGQEIKEIKQDVVNA